MWIFFFFFFAFPHFWTSRFILLQVMIDFQAAERKRLEEPASEVGLEPLCAMVCELFDHLAWDNVWHLH